MKKELITSLFENTFVKIIYELYKITQIFYCLLNWAEIL